MTVFDRDYLERRALQAINLAQVATHPAAVRAHYTMASIYLSRLDPANDGPPPLGELYRDAM